MPKHNDLDIYPFDPTMDPRDGVFGFDFNTGGKSKNFKLEHLRYFILEGLDASNNGFLVNNGYTLVDNILTINAGWQWLLNGLLCTNEEEIVFTLEYAAEGFVRIDSIYVNSDGEFLATSGGESETIAVPPLIPINTLLAFSINIFDTNIEAGEDPVLGSIYVKKEFSKSVNFNGSGSDVVIPLSPDGFSEIRLSNSGLVSISGLDLSLMTGSNFESPYQGKEIMIWNLAGVDVLLKHDDFENAEIPFNFISGADLVFPANEKMTFKYDEADGLYDIDKSWTIVDDVIGLPELLELKADKTYVDALVVGLWDDRGSYDASVNLFPSTGGSGTTGSILKGDIWTISVSGTLGSEVVEIGDTVRALIDAPGTTPSNWAIQQNNIGYVPLSSNESIYPDATLPLSDTDILYVKQGASWKKVAVSEFGSGGSSFKGVWNAETNTPTLVNGTGTLGDEYEVSVSGVQFGDIFLPPDTIYYNASNVWVKKQNNNQSFAQNLPLHYLYLLNSGAPQAFGESGITENASAINGNLAFTSFFNGTNEITCRRYYTSAIANSITNIRNNSFLRLTENMAFSFELTVRNDDTAVNLLGRSLFGMAQTGSIGNVDPSQMTGFGIGLAADSADTTMQILFKSGIGAGTGVIKVPTTWTKTDKDLFRIQFLREANSTKLFYRIKNVTLNSEIVGMQTYNQGTNKLTLYCYKGPSTNPIQTGFDFIENKLYTSY